jgi:hypothetical protein
MTAVGDKHLLATETLLLADDEVGTFLVPIRELDGGSGINAFSLKVSVKFTAPDAPEASARWEYDHGTLKMVFSGWSDREGSSFRRAKRLGEHKGVPFGFNVAHQRLGELNQVTFQFYTGGTYE